MIRGPHLLLLALLAGWASLRAADMPAPAPAPLASTAIASTAVHDDAQCRTIRLSDIGWADVTATTALFSDIVQDLGYRPRVTLLSVPVTFASMKWGNIDVFLGNWMPAQAPIIQPYLKDHTIAVIGPNLAHARYTLAVPAYTYAAGLRNFKDIVRFGPQLKDRIYGLEPGSPADHILLGMIHSNLFGLGHFRVVASSEAGMLAQVARAVRERRPIVFLGWEPHPMNMEFHLKYLRGGAAVFGPDYGSAQVFTNTRAGYEAQCPNIGRLLRNLKFTVKGETQIMYAMLQRHEPPRNAAAAWLAAHPLTAAAWLAGVRTFTGGPGLTAVLAPHARQGSRSFQGWIASHKLPVGEAATVAIDYIKAHGRGFFEALSGVVRGAVDGLTALLTLIPSWLLLLTLCALAWALRRSIAVAVFVALALLLIMNLGYWADTLETLSLVIVATSLSTLIGVPVGIAAAHRPMLNAVLRPVLDLMQTLPTFVYLIPTLVLFGLGVVPGLISTVIFALPAPIRMTQLGVSSVPKPLLEAGEAFGATRLQMLLKVELPSAAPTILAGITQCIMLSLSMVVIAALVGAGGLGVPVIRALNTVQIGMGFEAGLVIVLLAIILDRIFTRPPAKDGKS
jgi:glycine betaine/proline transport system substrate-binding protein